MTDSFLDMPDAEVENLSIEQLEEMHTAPAAEEVTDVVDDAEVDGADLADADTESADDAVGDDGDDPEGETGTDGVGEGEEGAAEDDPAGEAEGGESEADSDEDDAVDKETEQDYKSRLEEVFAPFKANGKEMKIDNVEDVRQLMQMGANYNKKMAALKPNLKMLKMLENNQLLDENKLSYLIDLDKKDPNAIAKLMKDSGIDPLSVDVESNTEYQPNTYNVDDKEMELDSVLDEIQDTPSYNDTMEIISNKWDEPSKRLLVSNPSIIGVINAHVENGLYAQVSAEVERERVLGRLSGLSDLEAYKQVGDRMHADQAFKSAPQGTPDIKAAAAALKKPAAKKAEDPKLNIRRRAAGSTKSAPPRKGGDADYNPLGLSDEEFDRQYNARLL